MCMDLGNGNVKCSTENTARRRLMSFAFACYIYSLLALRLKCFLPETIHGFHSKHVSEASNLISIPYSFSYGM